MIRFDLAAYFARNNAAVESALSRFLGPADGNRLTAAMRYSLMAGGKRIRPNFCIAAAEAVGGQPTCHKAFDEATAILAGDALLTLAFEVLAAMAAGSCEARLEVIRLIAAAAGFQGMVLGQMLDMESEGRTLDRDALQILHGRKTGDMIQAALICGALIAGGSEPQIHPLTLYGRAVGLAFQVVDDILNVEGDPALMGKAVGTDKLRRKNSYPERADPLRAIAAYVVERRK
ncbi:MAG: polyprenyl synthetase family protein [Desulfobacterales bacterium]|nr:polyprenyl synthetase family protein [Desulfobacterales bacterium]